MTTKLSESTKNSICEYIKLHDPISSQQVADRFNLSRKTIERLDCWRKYKEDKKKDYEERLRLAKEYSAKNPEATISEISEKFNISRATLQKELINYVKKPNELTDLEIRKILNMRANHPYLTIHDIAMELGHCPKVIRKYIRLHY